MSKDRRLREAAAHLIRLSRLRRLAWNEAGEPNTFSVSFEGVIFNICQAGNIYSLSADSPVGDEIDSFSASPFEKEDHLLLREVYRLAADSESEADGNLEHAINSLKESS